MFKPFRELLIVVDTLVEQVNYQQEPRDKS
jgi:hypothetical protein